MLSNVGWLCAVTSRSLLALSSFLLVTGGADLPCYMGKTFAVKVEFSLEALFLIKY